MPPKGGIFNCQYNPRVIGGNGPWHRAMQSSRLLVLFISTIVSLIITLLLYYHWELPSIIGRTNLVTRYNSPDRNGTYQEKLDKSAKSIKLSLFYEKEDRDDEITKIPRGEENKNQGIQKKRDQGIETTKKPTVEGKFLLDNKYCLFPDLDPFENAAKDTQKVTCTGKPSITYIDGSYLKVNWTRIKNEYGGNFKYCEYLPVTREGTRSDFAFRYGNLSKKFDREILVSPEHEYMKVHCYSKSDKRIITNFHAAVVPKKDVEERCDVLFKKHKAKYNPKEIFNVHFIGMDSVSRLNSMRNMPKTRKFLLNDLQAFEMTGYNKVADNTFVNIIPLTMGKYVSEMGWDENNRAEFDKYDFFWKNFTRAGYRTLYAEDAPKIAIFVIGKKGFKDPPTDYYNRHLQLAMEEEKDIWNGGHHCIGDTMETKRLLDYATDFSRVFKNKPHFGFTFITRLSHDGGLAAADTPYLEFLKRYKQEGHLENTVLVFFSDHGYRFGRYRQSYQGKVEDRFPMMFLVFPPKFHQKYPHLVQNLRINSRRLTTPFDIYETIKDILYFDGMERKANIMDRGISLFKEIPKERNCQHAQISHHWCLCMEEKKLNTESELARTLGEQAIRLVNNLLISVKHLCVELTLGKITAVVEKKWNENMHQYERVVNTTVSKKRRRTNAPLIYQITLNALPSKAHFEVTLQSDPWLKTFQLAGDVSRLDQYNRQSDCIDDFHLKLYCFCKRPKYALLLPRM